MKGIKTMTPERFKYLTDKKPMAIGSIRIIKAGVDINGGHLEAWGRIEIKNWRIQHLTKGGYYSKKPLIIFDFDRVEKLPNGRLIIVITDEEGKNIANNFCDLDGKIFKTEHQLQMENAKKNHIEEKREGGAVGWITY